MAGEALGASCRCTQCEVQLWACLRKEMRCRELGEALCHAGVSKGVHCNTLTLLLRSEREHECVSG